MAVFSCKDFDQHEQVVYGYETASGLQAIIAIHNTNLGPALGGCRMYPYQSEDGALSDVLRLSRGMTYKSALANLPLGGGKSVIIGDPGKDKTPALFQAMGRLIDSLSGQYIVAQDSGTSVQDMNYIAKETRYVEGVKKVKDEQGNIRSGDPSPATAFGVFAGIKAAVRNRLKRSNLAGVKVAIQGVGNVGFVLAKQLKAEGAELVISDVNEAKALRVVNAFGAKQVAGDDIYKQQVDVFAPCALGGVINEKTIDTIKASIIAGSANNQLAQSKFGEMLHDRGILYAPDFVINAGGVIHVYYMRNERSWEDSARHVEGIGETLDEIFYRAEKTHEPPEVIANQLAEERFNPQHKIDMTRKIG